MFSTFAIVITLLLLMFFAYRGYSVLILAPIMATLAVLLSGDFLSTIPAYTDAVLKIGSIESYVPRLMVFCRLFQCPICSNMSTTQATTNERIIDHNPSDPAIFNSGN